MIHVSMLLSVGAGAVIGIAIGSIALGLTGGFFAGRAFFSAKLNKSKTSATRIVQEALEKAKTFKKEASFEAEAERIRLDAESNKQIQAKTYELQTKEDRINLKEEQISKSHEEIANLKAGAEKMRADAEAAHADAEKMKSTYAQKEAEIIEKLEKAASLTKEEAKKQLISSIETEAKKEAAVLAKNIENEARETADKKSKEIISLAIQKYAADQTSDATISVVALPNDEVKGRIIGREGRNIKALESATGVDLIVDDTPEVITVSGFDPIRREIARLSLEKLIMDGRIHPARIEEIVEKVKRDIEITMKEAGENAILDAGIVNMHPEIVKTLGRLKYRTSYGQNVLQHSLEVCHLAGLMAAEIGANVMIAKRGGLLHDIGKAVDFEQEGTHVSLGVDLARKHKESEAVVHCIEAHHGNVEYKSIEAILVQAADAISSSRPGARRENLENYVKRLRQLEEIANGFKGVEKSYAIQAGREIRIIVKPEEIDDATALFMAKDIAKKIEAEMEYPGQIKVNVVRETRSVEYAK